MMLTLALLIPTLLLLLTPETQSAECKPHDDLPWSYGNAKNGPMTWGKSFRECSDKNQSPIDIQSKVAKTDSGKFSQDKLINYTPVTQATVLNTGMNVKVTPEDKVERTYQINGKNFKLQYIEIHLGANKQGMKKMGSEHAIDNAKGDMEIQAIHKSDDGQYAISAAIFQIGNYNKEFVPITVPLDSMRFKGDSEKMRHPLDLKELLGMEGNLKYRYMGSLTSPPCTENVIWTVASGFLEISGKQINLLKRQRSVAINEGGVGCVLLGNYRPLQELNGREVLYNGK